MPLNSMNIKKQEKQSKAIKFEIMADGQVVGRAYLYLIANDLGRGHYGLLEDVFVAEDYRGRGLGNELVKAVIQEARKQNCYKLIGTSRHSRPEVHEWYQRLGFKDYGREFRMDF